MERKWGKEEIYRKTLCNYLTHYFYIKTNLWEQVWKIKTIQNMKEKEIRNLRHWAAHGLFTWPCL